MGEGEVIGGGGGCRRSEKGEGESTPLCVETVLKYENMVHMNRFVRAICLTTSCVVGVICI